MAYLDASFCFFAADCCGTHGLRTGQSIGVDSTLLLASASQMGFSFPLSVAESSAWAVADGPSSSVKRTGKRGTYKGGIRAVDVSPKYLLIERETTDATEVVVELSHGHLVLVEGV